MSKQAWGTITPAPFPLGYQRIPALQMQQAVERLHSGRGPRAPRSGYPQHIRQVEAEFAQRHKSLGPDVLKQLLERLTDKAAEKASDQCRVQQGKLGDIGILNSYAWKGWN